jgi:hypothetical protein
MNLQIMARILEVVKEWLIELMIGMPMLFDMHSLFIIIYSSFSPHGA